MGNFRETPATRTRSPDQAAPDGADGHALAPLPDQAGAGLDQLERQGACRILGAPGSGPARTALARPALEGLFRVDRKNHRGDRRPDSCASSHPCRPQAHQWAVGTPPLIALHLGVRTTNQILTAGSEQGLRTSHDHGFRSKTHRADQQAAHQKQRDEAPAVVQCALCRSLLSSANAHRHHHTKERRHDLLKWVWLCPPCHRSVHQHPAQSRKTGLL